MTIGILKRKLLDFGGLRGGGGGDTGGSSSTTVQKADPWIGQQPYLQYGFAEAQNQYANQVPQYYPGQITAPLDPLSELGQAHVVSQTPQMEQFSNLTASSNAFNMNQGRDPQTNPYLQSAIQAALDPMVRDFNDAGGTMSQIRSEAITNDQLGGSRQGIAEGLAADRLQRNMLGTAAQMANQGYQGAQDAATRSIALAPQTQSMMTTPGATLDAVGAQRQAYEQQLINDAVQEWNFQQNLPSAMLSQFMNLIQGNWGGTSTATSTGTGGYQRDPFSSALGGAMSGWQIGSMVPGMGPVGAGIGALLSFL